MPAAKAEAGVTVFDAGMAVVEGLAQPERVQQVRAGWLGEGW